MGGQMTFEKAARAMASARIHEERCSLCRSIKRGASKETCWGRREVDALAKIAEDWTIWQMLGEIRVEVATGKA